MDKRCRSNSTAFAISAALNTTKSWTSGSRRICTRPQHLVQNNRTCRLLTAPVMAGGPPVRSTDADTPLKKFLTGLKPLGDVRLIATNGAAVMEAIATFDSLFFATLAKGCYANIIDPKINLDLHLLLPAVGGARFEVGVSRSASKAPTYIIRMLGKQSEDVVLSIFLQWAKEPSDIAEERIDAWKRLQAEYVLDSGDTAFFSEE